MDVLYFHNHMKSLLIHKVSSVNFILDEVSPKNPYTVTPCTIVCLFLTFTQRLALRLLFPSSLPCFFHIKGTAHVSMQLCAFSGFNKHLMTQKAVYCHPAYLTYMQSTSCERPGWMKHKLESRLPGEISITSDTQMTPPLWQKVQKN